MRQAGRYLPEYRAIREAHDFLTLCKNPELATRITLQPVERLGVDAAILFSDIMIPMQSLGISLTFDPGPVLENPLRHEADINNLVPVDGPQIAPAVYETIRMLVNELPAHIPLIGFAGAPFTLAAYLVEGRGTRQFGEYRKLIYQRPDLFAQLMETLTVTITRYLRAQIDAGVKAVQLFDTWAGLLPPPEYEQMVLPSLARIFNDIQTDGVARIYFMPYANAILPLLSSLPVEVVGIDSHIRIDQARALLGPHKAIQGNFEPYRLFSSREDIQAYATAILTQGKKVGHIFNLGHGVPKDVSADAVQYLVDLVKAW